MLQEDTSVAKRKVNKKFKLVFLLVAVVCAVALLIIVLITSMDNDYEQTVIVTPESTISHNVEERNLNNFKNLINDNYPYSSTTDNFKIVFPSQPTKSSDSNYSEELGGNIQMTTYHAINEDVSYGVVVYDYASPKISESNPDFNVEGALEGTLNGMISACSSGEIISQSAKKVNNNSLDFTIICDGEYLQGFVIFHDVKLYLTMVGYIGTERPDSDKIDSYLGSFSFLQ